MTTETLLGLLKHKTFKGDNDLYLSARSMGIPVVDKLTYLQFDSIDKNEETVMTEIPTLPSPKTKKIKTIMLKSENVNKYWKRNSTTNLILVDTDVPNPSDPDMVFEVVDLTNGLIALRNLGNNMYCGRQTVGIHIVDSKTNGLRASFTDTTAKETHMVYEDLKIVNKGMP